MLWGNFLMEPTALSGKGFFMNKKLGLLGMGSEALLNGVQAEWTDDKGKEYPEEEFFETETDMTEFEGKLEDITA